MITLDQLPDTISITWTIADVKSLDESLTDDECRQVLAIAEKNHDASIGINWDVLETYIDEVAGERV